MTLRRLLGGGDASCEDREGLPSLSVVMVDLLGCPNSSSGSERSWTDDSGELERELMFATVVVVGKHVTSRNLKSYQISVARKLHGERERRDT